LRGVRKMNITDVKILPVEGDEKLKAFVTMKLADCFVVRDIKVINGTNGYFVAMPAKKMKDNSYRDLIHPVDKNTRTKLEQAILKEYWSVIEATEAAARVSASAAKRAVNI
jgi:stage V sporulation protein G